MDDRLGMGDLANVAVKCALVADLLVDPDCYHDTVPWSFFIAGPEGFLPVLRPGERR